MYVNLTNCSSLDYLFLGYTGIETIDFTGCSELNKIDGLSNLFVTNLDLSGAVNLESIHWNCFDPNGEINSKLTSINLTENAKLIKFEMFETNVSSLDLSNNTSLEEFNCSNNKLSSLIFSDNVVYKTIFCNDNELTELIIPSGSIVEYLVCSENRLLFSTLPAGNINNYVYSPQQKWVGDPTGYFSLINLTSEYNINGIPTTYTWYNADTGELIEGMMADGMGNFIAGFANAGKTLLCKMTNPGFPDLTLEYEVLINSSATFKNAALESNLENFQLIGPGISGSKINLYPNPVNDVLFINTTGIIDEIIIYDSQGKQVKKSTSGHNEINLQDLPSGYYIVHIVTNGKISSQKIIKN